MANKAWVCLQILGGTLFPAATLSADSGQLKLEDDERLSAQSGSCPMAESSESSSRNTFKNIIAMESRQIICSSNIMRRRGIKM
jgi:hypothetical protein